jgi:hypothetical protein
MTAVTIYSSSMCLGSASDSLVKLLAYTPGSVRQIKLAQAITVLIYIKN